MSPEQEARENEISLLAHVEARLADLQRQMSTLADNCDEKLADVRREMALRDKNWSDVHVSSQRAIDKAENEMRDKLAIMNEFRSALSDQARHFVLRDQFEDLRTRVEAAVTRVELEATVRARETRFVASETRLTTLERNTGNYSEERMTQLEGWRNNMQGRLWGIPMVIGVVVFVITQLMRFLFKD
jgi:hypothetical protein